MRQSARQKRPTFILCPTMGEVKGYVLHAPTDRDSEAVYLVCGFVSSILFSERDRPNEPNKPDPATRRKMLDRKTCLSIFVG
jgi:hypothetical protein